ncbi:MAG TPA: glutamate-5-semialdehyde dehydrogenase [Dehalococcoidia bacterium]|nr:glutamate-5-semialdehyde dehydrogenase [Dehalococcoidia bacterium]
MTTTVSELQAKGAAARAAARRLRSLSTAVKDRVLHNLAESLLQRAAEVLEANQKDYQDGTAAGLTPALLDRLLLNRERLAAMAGDVRQIAALPDPVGEIIEMRTLPNGLQVGRKRVPLGVIGAIYESRPNVTVDIAALAIKSGNACILRGGKEAAHSNRVLAVVIRDSLAAAGAPEDAVQFIENPDRALVGEMLKMRKFIDLMVPRGGSELIRFVAENAAMPVVTGGIGVCHTYVDSTAGLEMALDVVHNAKCRRPTICNALDTVLVAEDIAREFLPALGQRWAEAGVEMRCDEGSLGILKAAEIPSLKAIPAAEDDFGKEFLDLVAAVKLVSGLDEALMHIERFGSGHSEAIITQDYSRAQRFLDEVDAAAVYVNVSTQFTDGAQFGLGAEVGISTQKMHARGPMGLRELTSYKWVILGNGQTRP